MARLISLRIVVVWIALHALAPFAHGQSWAGVVDSELTERAATLELPEGVTVSASVVEAFIHVWDVSVDVAFVETLPGAGTPTFDPRAATVTWARDLNARLGALTATFVAETERDPAFNPATDVRVELTVSLPGSRVAAAREEMRDARSIESIEAMMAARVAGTLELQFVGSRLTRRSDSDERDAPNDDDVALVIEVIPDRLEWDVRETMTGVMHYRSVGGQRVPMSAGLFRFGGATLTDLNGVPPEFFLMKAHVNWGSMTEFYRFLDPDESIEIPFHVYTDQLQPMASGFIVPEGSWILTHRSFDAQDDVPLRVIPALVEVRSQVDEYTGPRITALRAADRDLQLMREDGRCDVIDVATGTRTGTFRPERRYLDLFENWVFRHSMTGPVGRQYDVVREEKRSLIRVREKDGTSRDIALPDDLALGVGGLQLRRVQPKGTLLAATNFRMYEIDLTTGAIVRADDTPMMWPQASGDGCFVIDLPNADQAHNRQVRGDDAMTITIAERMNPENLRTVEITGHGEWPGAWFGVNALFLVDAFNSGVQIVSYVDGARSVIDTGHVALDAESPDGRLLAVRAPGGPAAESHTGAVTIEVWNTTTCTKVYEIEFDEDVRAHFLVDPLRLVCVPRVYATSTWYAERAFVHDGETGVFLNEVSLKPHDAEMSAP